jgi:S1-C subfamily serine protease
MRNTNPRRTFLSIALALVMLLGVGGVLMAAPGLQDDGQAGEEIGVLITSVQRGSPAARAGIARGDIILAAGDTTTDTVDELVAALLSATPGDEVVFTIQHGSETLERTVTLGERNGVAYLGVVPYTAPGAPMQEEAAPATETPIPAEEAAPATATPEPEEEMSATPAAEEEATAAPAEEEAIEAAALTDGAVIGEVVPESPAARAGLAEGDVVVAVNDEPVTVDNDLATIIGQLQPGDEVRLTVRTMQDDDEIILVATLGANPQDETRPFLGVRYGMLATLMEEAPAATPTPEAEEEAPAATPTPEAEEESAATPTPEAEAEPAATSTPEAEEETLVIPRPGMMRGALIVEVVPDSPAAAAGLQPGDVIAAVGGTPLAGDRDLATLIGDYAPGDEVELSIVGPGGAEERIVSLALGENPDDSSKAFLGVRYSPLGAPGMGSSPFRRGQMIPPETPRRDAPAMPDEDCDCSCKCDGDGRHRHYHYFHHGDEGMMPFGDMLPDGEMPPGIMPFFHHFGDIDPENLPPELREFLEEFGNQ